MHPFYKRRLGDPGLAQDNVGTRTHCACQSFSCHLQMLLLRTAVKTHLQSSSAPLSKQGSSRTVWGGGGSGFPALLISLSPRKESGNLFHPEALRSLLAPVVPVFFLPLFSSLSNGDSWSVGLKPFGGHIAGIYITAQSSSKITVKK